MTVLQIRTLSGGQVQLLPPPRRMFETLDTIDWSPVPFDTDVPGQLREFPVATEDRQREIVRDWYGTLWSEGTMYPATPLAVPFLLEIAAEPRMSVRVRTEVLGLLHFMAIAAADNRMPPAGPGDAAFQATNRELYGRIGQLLADGLAVYLGVIDELPDAAPTPLRAQAACVIGECRDRARESVDELMTRVTREPDPMLAASYAWAAASLHYRTAGTDEEVSARAVCAAAFQAATTPGSRWVAACATCRADSNASRDVIEELFSAARNPEPIAAEIDGWPNQEPVEDLVCTTLRTLWRQGHVSRDRVLETAHELIRQCEGDRIHRLIDELFSLTMSDADLWPSQNQPLQADQIAAAPRLLAALRLVAGFDPAAFRRSRPGVDEGQGVDSVVWLLERWGLPSTRDGLQELIRSAEQIHTGEGPHPEQ